MHRFAYVIPSFLLLLLNIIIHSHALSPAAKENRGTNRLFLDTAVESEWYGLSTGMFHGITTNPALLEKAGHKCTVESVRLLSSRALALPNCSEFMCQAWGRNSVEMFQIGMQLSEVDRERIVIKVPVTLEGTQAAKRLIDSGVRVCLTACYNSDQAMIASGLGAEYIAPYLGRMIDNRKNGLEEVARMQRIVNGMGSKTRILVASIRDLKQMSTLMEYGMNTFTFNPDLARDMFRDPLTIAAAAEFEECAERMGAYKASASPRAKSLEEL
jgi:transaldolase